ncbi:MAG TPA: glycosyltransferase family 39 protein, partial [Geminicoccaceae bacterium]
MRASRPAVAGAVPAGASRPALPGPVLPLLVAAAAALLYTLGLGRAPHPDELYQTLAAQGLLATGEPRIAEGLYTRAYAQTWLIAQSLRLFGDTLEAARLSSLLSVAAAAGILFAWLRREAGPAAAWLGAAGFALSPFAVETAQFARIYGVQTLAFLLACLAVHGAVLGPRPPPPPGGEGATAAAAAPS